MVLLDGRTFVSFHVPAADLVHHIIQGPETLAVGVAILHNIGFVGAV